MNYATTTSHSNQVSKQFLLLDEPGCNMKDYTSSFFVSSFHHLGSNLAISFLISVWNLPAISVFSNSPLPNRAHHCPMYVAIYPIIILIISFVIFLWFSFKVYAPDMPNRLPVSDFVGGLVKNILRALKYWFHYTLVALAWLGVVPITACESRVLLNIILLLVSRGA